eukprot:IDg2624t1
MKYTKLIQRAAQTHAKRNAATMNEGSMSAHA